MKITSETSPLSVSYSDISMIYIHPYVAVSSIVCGICPSLGPNHCCSRCLQQPLTTIRRLTQKELPGVHPGEWLRSFRHSFHLTLHCYISVTKLGKINILLVLCFISLLLN